MIQSLMRPKSSLLTIEHGEVNHHNSEDQASVTKTNLFSRYLCYL